MKRILFLLVFIMLFAALQLSGSCEVGSRLRTLPNQSNYQRLHDISANKVKQTSLNVTDKRSYCKEIDREILVVSYDKTSTLSFFDTTNKKLWDYEINAMYFEIELAAENYVIIHSGKELLAIDYNGKKLWSGEKFRSNFCDTAYFSDKEGGFYVLGEENKDGNRTCMLYHISGTGEVLNCAPYDKAGDISPTKVLNGSNNDYWLSGSYKSGNNRIFLAHLNSGLNIDRKFEIKENQYPTVMLLPEKNKILLYGQAYTNNSITEYGFVYETDLSLNQKAYKTFDVVPDSICQLNDGRFIVSFYDRKNAMKDLVKIFDVDWNEIKNINIQYSYTKLHATSDGGFIITGGRLSPGQGYGSLFRNFVRPKIDTIYERYNSRGRLICRKTFFAEKSADGFGYYSVVRDGSIILV